MTVVAAILTISMFVAAAPAVLWPPVLLSIPAAFLIWRAAGPRRATPVRRRRDAHRGPRKRGRAD